MIVLDASVLTAHLDSTDALHDRAVALLMASGDEALAASALTLAEILVGPARTQRLDDATVALSRLEIATVPLDDAPPVRLATLRAATGLKLPDCCVLLAAERTNAEIATFDLRLAAVAGQRGLAIRPG